MKIEKLTENKIRVVVQPSDLHTTTLDVQALMSKAFSEQTFFNTLLEKAKKELGFNTDGCKLLIEAFSSLEDFLVFTITKYSTKTNETKNFLTGVDFSKKRLTVKRKNINLFEKQLIYKFENIDAFCDFCNYINRNFSFDIKMISKDISLYFYRNSYYLFISNINTSYKYTKKFYSIASEFSTSLSYSNNFENKLREHGKVIMKKNAIALGIKYFASN